MSSFLTSNLTTVPRGPIKSANPASNRVGGTINSARGVSIAGNFPGAAGNRNAVAGNAVAVASYRRSVAGNGLVVAGNARDVARDRRGIAGVAHSVASNDRRVAGNRIQNRRTREGGGSGTIRPQVSSPASSSRALILHLLLLPPFMPPREGTECGLVWLIDYDPVLVTEL